MLDAQDTQFRLAEDGQISFQAQASNPLPGDAIGMLNKGDDILKPKVVLLDNELVNAQDKTALAAHLDGWLERHIATVLEPLVVLEKNDHLKPVSKRIAEQVHEALGIVPREGLESLIADLDTDDRRDLRGLKIRLGPILVFIPALNKPAAVRLRALLWGLWNDKDLPMDCPKDGIVSFEVDPKAVDHAFYQAIAYPVYGKRAIRIDMLDRVICAVYDGAEGGTFKAEHKMAEWLGSSIEGLYDILSAMGHTKISDPAQQEQAEAGDNAVEEKSENKPAEKSEETADQIKPELATFRLKKGKAFEKSDGAARKKPFNKKDKPAKKKGKRNKSTNRTPKVMSVGPEKKLEDSPFAILEQLKQSNEKS